MVLSVPGEVLCSRKVLVLLVTFDLWLSLCFVCMCVCLFFFILLWFCFCWLLRWSAGDCPRAHFPLHLSILGHVVPLSLGLALWVWGLG